MLALPEALNNKAGEGSLSELQVLHDILLDICSRNGEGVEAEPLWTFESQ